MICQATHTARNQLVIRQQCVSLLSKCDADIPVLESRETRKTIRTESVANTAEPKPNEASAEEASCP